MGLFLDKYYAISIKGLSHKKSITKLCGRHERPSINRST